MESLILSKAQAWAIYESMCYLNNVGALIGVSIETHRGLIKVQERADGIVHVSIEGSLCESPRHETYDSQVDFCSTYSVL